MLRRAVERAEARRVAADPAEWGVSAEVIRLPTGADVGRAVERIDGEARRGIVHRRASDAFSALHAAGGLTPAQHAAARLYWDLWRIRAGERPAGQAVKVDVSRRCPSGATVAQIDAGRKIEQVHARVGRCVAALLTALTEPMVMRGEVRVWRELVRAQTGETERHAQAAVVRQACEALRLAYEDGDTGRAAPARSASTRSATAGGRAAAAS